MANNRETAYNIAHNRSGTTDPLPAADKLAKFMDKGEAERRAVVQANNKVPSDASAEDVLEMAERIKKFIGGEPVKPLPKAKKERKAKVST